MRSRKGDKGEMRGRRGRRTKTPCVAGLCIQRGVSSENRKGDTGEMRGRRQRRTRTLSVDTVRRRPVYTKRSFK